jgi:hypothetical protein
MSEPLREEIKEYNLTLDQEILIEEIAAVQASYFRLLDMENVELQSNHPLAILSLELSKIQNEVLMCQNEQELLKTRSKIELSKTILSKYKP